MNLFNFLIKTNIDESWENPPFTEPSTLVPLYSFLHIEDHLPFLPSKSILLNSKFFPLKFPFQNTKEKFGWKKFTLLWYPCLFASKDDHAREFEILQFYCYFQLAGILSFQKRYTCPKKILNIKTLFKKMWWNFPLIFIKFQLWSSTFLWNI